MAVITTFDLTHAALDAILQYAPINSGGSKGYIDIRTGNPPSSCEASATGTRLCVAEFETSDDDVFEDAGDPVDTQANAKDVDGIVAQGTILATGTAGYFRLCRHDDTVVLQGTVGAYGSSANMILSSASFVTGYRVVIETLRIILSGLTPV